MPLLKTAKPLKWIEELLLPDYDELRTSNLITTIVLGIYDELFVDRSIVLVRVGDKG